MYKTIAIVFILSVAALSGCKKSILEEGEESSAYKNVQLEILPYWNNQYFSPDSVYFAGGTYLKLDEVQIVFSSFFMESYGDSLLPRAEPVQWLLSSSKSVGIGSLDPGTYSGSMYFYVGLDSATNFYPPEFYPSSSLLSKEKSLYRGTGQGYNFVTITGRTQDPDKPNSEPDQHFKWVIATNDLDMKYTVKRSFNAPAGRPVSLGVKLQLDQLFNGLYPALDPEIICDFNDNKDWNNAQTLHANFVNNVFLIQF